MAGGAGAFALAPLTPATVGCPSGADTTVADGALTARQFLSFEVRSSTDHFAETFSVCQSSTRLSCGDSLGASPIWRYGFSRNRVEPVGVWLSRSAAAANKVATGIVFDIAGFISSLDCERRWRQV